MNTCKEKVNFIYQAYGGTKFYDEAIASILSLLYWKQKDHLEIEVIVYTDSKQAFESIPSISTISLSKERIKEIGGSFNYIHRRKVEIILDALITFGNSIIYTDTDTFWTSSPSLTISKLLNGYCLLHKEEEPVSSSYHHNLHNYLLRNKQIGIPADAVMYNAGCIGIPYEKASIVAEVLAVIDRMLIDCRKRVWVEQLIFSVYLSKEPMYLVDEALFHYWDATNGSSGYLRDFVRASLDVDIKEGYNNFSREELYQHANRKKTSFSIKVGNRRKKLKSSLKKRLQDVKGLYYSVFFKHDSDSKLELVRKLRQVSKCPSQNK